MSLIVFACVLGGTFVGIFLRNRLPEHHLGAATKDVVRLGAGLIGTIAALVLGLLIASANSTYQTQSSQIQQLTANIVALDQSLTQYGPETAMARNQLRRAVPAVADRIWHENGCDSKKAQPFEASAAGLAFYDEILKLSPQNATQRSLQAGAVNIAQDLAKTRLLLFAEAGVTIPMPFLFVLVSWLAVIFAKLQPLCRQQRDNHWRLVRIRAVGVCFDLPDPRAQPALHGTYDDLQRATTQRTGPAWHLTRWPRMQKAPAEDQWSVLIDEQQYGPFGLGHLKELAAQGRLLEGDWVWKPGLAAWIAAGDVSGLFAKSARIQTGSAQLNRTGGAEDKNRQVQRNLKARAKDQIKNFGLMFLYLWVVFGLLAIHESMILSQYQLSYQAHGLATSMHWYLPRSCSLPKTCILAKG